MLNLIYTCTISLQYKKSSIKRIIYKRIHLGVIRFEKMIKTAHQGQPGREPGTIRYPGWAAHLGLLN
jgi:hypothetical protein